jgi:glycosyltransferase involved in cell wall biosynthesis
MKISIVIPTHNRQELFMEAVGSILAQPYANWEIVLVDDGSQPPIDAGQLQATLGNKLVFIRHDTPSGIARAKNAGVNAATGEVITLLDDDDLLAENTLDNLNTWFETHRTLDCIFLGALPFGPNADGAASNRTKSLGKLIQLAKPTEKDGLYFFDGALLDALLTSVPIDLQRPAARRGAWNIVGGFDEAGLFSESSWAIKAASICKIALAISPLTRWRIHGNNFGWISHDDPAEAQTRQINNTITSNNALLQDFQRRKRTISTQEKLVSSRLSDDYFSKAYLLRGIDKKRGLQALFYAFATQPKPKQLKLLVSYFLRVH